MYFSSLWWMLLLVAVLSYLIGNINNAIIISKFKHKDVRNLGSGNPGTLNMSRNFGVKIGLLTLFLDMLKGFVPTLIAKLIFKKFCYADTTLPVYYMAQYLAGFSVVIGHIFPVFFKFKGGKGIASTIGVFLVGEWYVTVIFGLIAIGFILLTKIGSIGSFIATTPSAIAAILRLYFLFGQTVSSVYKTQYFIFVDVVCIFGIVFLTWFAHRANIKRLLAGVEHDTDWLKMIKDAINSSKAKRAKKLEETALEKNVNSKINNKEIENLNDNK